MSEFDPDTNEQPCSLRGDANDHPGGCLKLAEILGNLRLRDVLPNEQPLTIGDLLRARGTWIES